MTDEEKAKIILEALDEYTQVNWNFEKYYIKGIKNGLKKIKEKEGSNTDEKVQNRNTPGDDWYRLDPIR